MDENRKTVSDRNFTVSLLENLKTFLARLFSDFNRILKVNTWSVRLETPIVIPEPIDTRDHLQALLTAIKNIPEPEKMDVMPVCDMIQKLIDKPDMEIPPHPTAMEITNQPDMESVSNSIVEAIRSIPKADKTDLTKLEKIVSDKTVSMKEMKEVIVLLKMVIETLNKEQPEVPEEKPISEKIEYYSDGTYQSSTIAYPSKICTETRIPGEKEDTYLYEEVNV